ncbi:MAG: hypothetical protein WC893_01145 [Candidatus Paceibacterota bacterium]|jgi:hypothetical protein
MNNLKNNKETGLAKLIVMIVVIILILSYLGINIQKIAESETGQANFGYVWNSLKTVWDYLVNFWNEHLENLILNLLKKIPFSQTAENLLK